MIHARDERFGSMPPLHFFTKHLKKVAGIERDDPGRLNGPCHLYLVARLKPEPFLAVEDEVDGRVRRRDFRRQDFLIGSDDRPRVQGV